MGPGGGAGGQRTGGRERDVDLDCGAAVEGYACEDELGRGGRGSRRGFLLDELFVGDVVARGAAPDVVFAFGRGEVIFVAEFAAHVSGIGVGYEEGQFEFREEAVVGLADLVVGFECGFVRVVKGVKVFH